MRRSTDQIITTHAGSLPRPDLLREAWARLSTGPQQEAELNGLLRSSVSDVLRKQRDAEVDIPNDGEFGKPMRAALTLLRGEFIFLAA